MKNNLNIFVLSAVLTAAVSAEARAVPPDSLYCGRFSRKQIDSVYAECRRKAVEENSGCSDVLALYLMSEWAYRNSSLGLSEFYIGKAVGSNCRDNVLKADCLSQASIIEQRKGNLQGAIGYAERCLDLDRAEGNPENVSSSLNNIAGMYLTSGQYDIAKRYIDEAVAMERNLGRDAYMAVRLGMASEIYLKLGDADSALKYADEAFVLDSLAGRGEKVAIRRCQRASALAMLGRDDGVLRDLELAVPVLENENSLNSLAIAYAQIGEASLHEHRPAEAEHAFLKCIEAAAAFGNHYVEARGHKGIWQTLRETSPAEALAHLEAYSRIQAQINSDKAAEELARFDVKYETLKREQTIAMQKQKLKWWTVSVVLLSGMLVLVCIALVFYRRLSRTTEEKNAMLVREALDRDRLLMLARSNMERELKKEIETMSSHGVALPKIKLTSREVEIARLTADGMLSKEIAAHLGISQRTVETHKNNLYRKLGINNIVELVNYMHKSGLC